MPHIIDRVTSRPIALSLARTTAIALTVISWVGCDDGLRNPDGVAHSSSTTVLSAGSVAPENACRTETSGPALGTWHVRIGDAWRTVTVQATPTCRLAGNMTMEATGAQVELAQVEFDPAAMTLAFRDTAKSGALWYRGVIDSGVLVGRAALVAGPDQPKPAAYGYHLTGWNSTVFDAQLVPRTWDILLADGRLAVLRLDRSGNATGAGGSSDKFTGRFKVYAHQTRGSLEEDTEMDLTGIEWDGSQFRAHALDSQQIMTIQATVSGRRLFGNLTRNPWTAKKPLAARSGDLAPAEKSAHATGAGQAKGASALAMDTVSQPVGTHPRTGVGTAFTGARSEVLGFGLAAQTPQQAAMWRTQMRKRLELLVMAGNPLPSTSLAVLTGPAQLPSTATVLNYMRDDNPDNHQRNYVLHDVALKTQVQPQLPLFGPRDGQTVERSVHLVVAVPTTPPPPQGYPLAIAFNGHWGSARTSFDPNTLYWYGDAFARRGYVVVAVDVGHRPVADRGGLYADLADGDDSGSGNGTHPAIAAANADSDWQEDGERAWDAMRGLDYGLSQPAVNKQQVVAVGLSMGAEIATWLAALDTRVQVAVPAGYSPDLHVMAHHGNHPCWQWATGDVSDWFDHSDLLALIGDRAVIVETGIADKTFSATASPFAADKQVLRRARAAFGANAKRVVHYLHPHGHIFHAADTYRWATAIGLTRPLLIAPKKQTTQLWQVDGTTLTDHVTLFEEIEHLVRSAPPRTVVGGKANPVNFN